jgi:hypothetical protein
MFHVLALAVMYMPLSTASMPVVDTVPNGGLDKLTARGTAKAITFVNVESIIKKEVEYLGQWMLSCLAWKRHKLPCTNPYLQFKFL